MISDGISGVSPSTPSVSMCAAGKHEAKQNLLSFSSDISAFSKLLLWLVYDYIQAELQRRIQAMEVRCYHKILRISFKDHVTNEEVHMNTS